MMVSIVEYTENFVPNRYLDLRGRYADIKSISNTTCIAAVAASEELKAKAILAPTTSGMTALEVSKCRPASDIYAFSPDPVTVRQMMLLWGVRPSLAERAHSTDELLEDCIDIIDNAVLATEGDIFVFIAGVVTGRHGHQRSETNTMRIIQL
jgi:pyruvate kinase